MQLNAKILRFSDYALHLQQTNLTLFTLTESGLYMMATSNNLKRALFYFDVTHLLKTSRLQSMIVTLKAL